MFKQAPILPPVAQPFVGTINHPDVYIWDAWTCLEGTRIHLYCLAVPRRFGEREIRPSERNQFAFHIRHFTSEDQGVSWVDRGAFLQTTDANSNIWSGSMLAEPDGPISAYTKTIWEEPDHPFVQSICVGRSVNFDSYEGSGFTVISDPIRDRKAIIEAGYYLADPGEIGSKDGEEGGPILAWRDPFLFKHRTEIEVIWCAKTAPSIPAIARARLEQRQDGFFGVELLPPIRLPDAAEFTQAELPKIWKDNSTGCFMLLVSACNRQHEHQPDSEVFKEMRLYVSEDVSGPWKAWSTSTSRVEFPPNAFGVSPYLWDASGDGFTSIVPLTEQATSGEPLSMLTNVQISLR